MTKQPFQVTIEWLNDWLIDWLTDWPGGSAQVEVEMWIQDIYEVDDKRGTFSMEVYVSELWFEDVLKKSLPN